MELSNSGEVFAGTTAGLYASSDFGNNWTFKSSGITGVVINTLLPSGNGKLFTGSGQGVYVSPDHGITWQAPGSGLKGDVYSLHFDQAGTLYASGHKTGVHVSNDFGNTWSYPANAGIGTFLLEFSINSQGHIFGISGNASQVYRSTNAGASWTTLTQGIPATPQTIAINGSDHIFIGTSIGIYRSMDNGNSWVAVNNGFSDSSFYHNSIAINPLGEILATSDNHIIYKSTNNGDSWNVLSFGTYYTNLTFDNQGRIYATPHDGVGMRVNRYTPGTGWEEYGDGIPPSSYYYYSALCVDSTGYLYAGLPGNTVFRTILPVNTNSGSAPSAPSNLTTTPVSYKEIDLSWAASASGSPLYYQIYRSTSTGSGFSQIAQVNNSVTSYKDSTLSPFTTYYYRVSASSLSGISGMSNESSSKTLLKPPVIKKETFVVGPTAPVVQNTSVTVSVAVEGTGPEVILHYGKSSDPVGSTIGMISNGSTYSATIPGIVVVPEGTWYRIKASNAAATDYFPSQDGRQSVPVKINADGIDTIMSHGAYPAGEVPDRYYTVGIPYAGTVHPSTQLGEQIIENGNYVNWRLQSYQNGIIADEMIMNSGQGYFIRHAYNTPVNFVDHDAQASSNPFGTFENYDLQPGWNLIPWPYAFSAALTTLDNSKIGSIWQQAAGQWKQVTVAKAFGGYAIYNKTADTLKVGDVIGYSPSLNKQAKEGKPSNIDWMIKLSVHSGNDEDGFNFIGAAAGADESVDVFDEEDPIGPGTVLNLYLDGPTKERSQKLSSDIRSCNEPGHIWTFTVDNKLHDPYTTLNLEMIDVPSTYSGYLIDVSSNYFLDLASAEHYSFSSRTNSFRIIVGEKNYVEAKVAEAKDQLPRKHDLLQNYPNPFNPTTRIRFDLAHSGDVRLQVFNILGQKVATLANGHRETGIYYAVWNGRDEGGNQVASGVYIYRLWVKQTGGQVTIQNKKMIFLK